MAETLADWARAMDCEPQFTVLSDDAELLVASFGTCSDLTPLRSIFIRGEGHHWPGGQTPRLPEALLGPRVNSFDATDEICRFFELDSSANESSEHAR